MGKLLPFARRTVVPIGKNQRRVTGFSVVLEARPGAVLFIADDLELGLTPDQARELARDLVEASLDADQVRT